MSRRRKKLFWQIYPPLLMISMLTLLGLLVITQYTFKQFYYEQVTESLEEKGHILKSQYKDLLLQKNYIELQRRVTLTSDKVKNRITIVLNDGTVVADSGMSPSLMGDHKSRPEIAKALEGHIASSKRFSSTMGDDLFYLAMPIKRGTEIIGVLRNSVPIYSLKEGLSGITSQIIAIALFLILILAAVNWWVSLKISTPLEVIKNYASQFKEDEFQQIPHINEELSVEIESLTLAFNRMGRRINKQFRKIYNQKEEREAVFNAMVEGVLSVNLQGKVFHWNRAACDFFGINKDRISKGLDLKEAFNNEELCEFFKLSLDEQKILEEEMVLDNQKVLQVHGTPLYASSGNKMGVLFVFNDISKMRELENHRKQFVSNVSHELRTPLTAIQGFVETLMEDGDMDKETREKFLTIVQRHATRLGNIVEDLLALSNIERDKNQNGIQFNDHDMAQVINLSVDNCERKAKAKNIKIQTHLIKGADYPMNSQLMEQAITNLIDNAVKYSPAQTTIDVGLEKSPQDIKITVKDQGPGIAPEHHERLFERFYSVDKARSREMGGSGLGLSIVKHIVQAHGGDVSIQSNQNNGSTFTISFPSNAI